MVIDTSNIRELLEQFMKVPPESITYRKKEHLFEVLTDFLLDNEEDLDEELKKLLQNFLDTLYNALISKDKELKNLKQRLIEDPAAVELTLSQMNMQEILWAELRGKKLRSPELRQQFENMVLAALEELCLKTTSVTN